MRLQPVLGNGRVMCVAQPPPQDATLCVPPIFQPALRQENEILSVDMHVFSASLRSLNLVPRSIQANR